MHKPSPPPLCPHTAGRSGCSSATAVTSSMQHRASTAKKNRGRAAAASTVMLPQNIQRAGTQRDALFAKMPFRACEEVSKLGMKYNIREQHASLLSENRSWTKRASLCVPPLCQL